LLTLLVKPWIIRATPGSVETAGIEPAHPYSGLPTPVGRLQMFDHDPLFDFQRSAESFEIPM